MSHGRHDFSHITVSALCAHKQPPHGFGGRPIVSNQLAARAAAIFQLREGTPPGGEELASCTTSSAIRSGPAWRASKPNRTSSGATKTRGKLAECISQGLSGSRSG